VGATELADWSVEVGQPGDGATPVARFGTGPTALVVLRPAHVEARERAAQEDRAAQAVAEREAATAARTAFGSSLAGNPRLAASDDVLTALRGGGVDELVLGALAALTVDHELGITAGPGWGAQQAAGIPHRDIGIILFDGRSTRRAGVAAALGDRLAALPPQYAPADVAAGGDGVVVTWSVPPPAPGASGSPLRHGQ
jgi:putative peptide zinc metalloprotease protein